MDLSITQYSMYTQHEKFDHIPLKLAINKNCLLISSMNDLVNYTIYWWEIVYYRIFILWIMIHLFCAF